MCIESTRYIKIELITFLGNIYLETTGQYLGTCKKVGLLSQY